MRTRRRSVARYLRVVRWARSRYTVNGMLYLDHGGAPSPYTRVERLAWDGYMSTEENPKGIRPGDHP